MKKNCHIEINERTINCEEGQTVLQAALANDMNIHHSCGGMGTCGTCRVFVKDGLNLLPPRNLVETEFADAYLYWPDERLSCQIPVVDGIKLRVPSKE